MSELVQRVEGQIWAAVRAAIESHASTVVEATMAGKYELASALYDEAARNVADGVLARPDVQAALRMAEAFEEAAKIAEAFDIKGVRNHGSFIARQIREQDDPEIVAPVTAAFAALEAAPDYYEHKEALSDIVHLLSEKEALTGGGPGFADRWEKAVARANELFEP